jgi:hypothetical protein
VADQNLPRPCPFPSCGSTNVELIKSSVAWVRCNDCSAEGPANKSHAKAIAMWNAAPRREEPK